MVYFKRKKIKRLLTQLCPTLCHPMDFSPPVSSVHGIFQVSMLEWPFPSPGDDSDPGIEPWSVHCKRILYHLSPPTWWQNINVCFYCMMAKRSVEQVGLRRERERTSIFQVDPKDSGSEVKSSMGRGGDSEGVSSSPSTKGLWPAPHLNFGLPILVLQERRPYTNFSL